MSYRATPGRMALGLAAGALTGAALVTLYVTLESLRYMSWYGISSQWPIGLLWFISSAVVWAMGLVAIGLPAWLYLHHRGRRHWLWAVSVGAALTFVAVFVIAIGTDFFWGMSGFSVDGGVDSAALTESQLASRKWRNALLASFVLSVIGSVVAAAVWRVAYRAAPANQ